jgi:hypothetical protein
MLRGARRTGVSMPRLADAVARLRGFGESLARGEVPEDTRREPPADA